MSKSEQNLAQLKSYYIKRLNEIIAQEFNIDKANFGIYEHEVNEQVSYIIANKMGVENFAISLLNSSQKKDLENNYDSLYFINDWDYGDVFINGIKFSDEQNIEKAFDNENNHHFNIGCYVIVLVLMSAMVIGFIQMFKYFF